MQVGKIKRELDELLGLDGEEEFAVYLAPVKNNPLGNGDIEIEK